VSWSLAARAFLAFSGPIGLATHSKQQQAAALDNLGSPQRRLQQHLLIVIGLAIAVNVASVVNQQIQVPEVSFSGLRVPRHLTELVPAAVFQLRNSGQEVGPDVADLRPCQAREPDHVVMLWL